MPPTVLRRGAGRTFRIELGHRQRASAGPASPSARVGGAGFYQYCPVDSWRPAVNLYESASSYFVCVDLAGMDRDAIDVTLNENVLVISGTREHPQPAERCTGLSIHLMEIDQGPFCRSVEIPSEVDLSAIRASYTTAGYLWIELPKSDGGP